MACDPKEAALALHRFGFGPREGSITAMADDPRGALLAELERPGAGQIKNPDLPTSGAANRAVFEYRAERNAEQKRQRREGAAQPAMEAPPAPSDQVPLPRQIFLNEARARIDAARDAEIGFVERLVWFWSNHFCVSQDKTVMAGAYEREAIRPHVLGRFSDMLLAAEGHPAMLLYLDNAQSIGPDSVAGINRDKGLNENFAREVFELHTLGVRTVYTQDDVTNFAKVLTGWTILPTVNNPDHGGEFVFNKRLHEPGPETVIGKEYDDTGTGQGQAVLADLARHPATAKHVATKLARHFIVDDPPPALVERLTHRFLDTGGNLKEVTKALVASSEAWMPEQAKIKRPGEWIVAALRATGETGDIRRIVQAQALLGEPLWRPPAPKGFSDDNAAWLDGLAQRLDIANAFAHREGLAIEPAAVMDAALGPLASAETQQTIARAEEQAAGDDISADGSGIPTEVTMSAIFYAPTRRGLLLGSGALFAWASVPRIARAEGRDPRFLVIVLRGALDGLAVVAPVGDPDWGKLRGDKALTLDGSTPALPLDGFFALNPAMANFHRLYQAGQAAVVHAAATPYRERSHFDGQDVLESGLSKPGAADSGWLNRTLAALEPGGPADPHGRQAFAVGPITPLVVRGPAPVLSWAPPKLPPVGNETTMRLLDLYRHTDPTFARVLEERIGLAAVARAGGMSSEPGDERPTPQAGGIAQVRAYFAEAAGNAGKFLAQIEGPRVGALAFDGWDTHVDEGIAKGRLANLLGALDGAIAAIETNMGEAWRQTVVVLVTEFGRTARINGNDGTDHGTATLALLAGGALKGGRVVADWPGVKEADLYEGRDLKPTTDLRAVLKGLLEEHLRADPQRLESTVFPGSSGVQPLRGLLA